MTLLNGLRATTRLGAVLCDRTGVRGGGAGREILGKPVTLAGPRRRRGGEPAEAGDRRLINAAPEERLRGLVWSAVFDDYARQRRLAPTTDKIGSERSFECKTSRRKRTEREQQRVALVEELKSPSPERGAAPAEHQHLDTLSNASAYSTRNGAQSCATPSAPEDAAEAERQVAAHWVRGWKINQALYREFGGRIIFQQAGWGAD